MEGSGYSGAGQARGNLERRAANVRSIAALSILRASIGRRAARLPNRSIAPAFAIDVEKCPKSQGRMKLVATRPQECGAVPLSPRRAERGTTTSLLQDRRHPATHPRRPRGLNTPPRNIRRIRVQCAVRQLDSNRHETLRRLRQRGHCLPAPRQAARLFRSRSEASCHSGCRRHAQVTRTFGEELKWPLVRLDQFGRGQAPGIVH